MSGTRPQMGMGEGHHSDDNEYGRPHSKEMFIEGDTKGFVSPEEIMDPRDGGGDPLHELLRSEQEGKGADLGVFKGRYHGEPLKEDHLPDYGKYMDVRDEDIEVAPLSGSVPFGQIREPDNFARHKFDHRRGAEMVKEQKPRHLEDGEEVREAKRQNLH